MDSQDTVKGTALNAKVGHGAILPSMPSPAHLAALAHACRTVGEPRLVLLFGSVARGKEGPQSDVDIAIDLGRALTVEDRLTLIDALGAATGRPIDLIDLRTAGVPLTGEILKNGVRLAGDLAAYSALIARHLTDVEDFMPAYRRLMDARLAGWAQP